MTELVIATGNAGKLREYQELLAGAGLELIAHDSGAEEFDTSYEENARLKAEAGVAARGLPSLGDDTGLEVDALDGAPGIRSARLAPTQQERTDKLLQLLAGAPRPWTATFVCVIALALPGGEPVVVRGECRGEVVPQWHGQAGFGYDPIFRVLDAGRTFGEMSSQEKHRWSHRGEAVRSLLATGMLASLR